mgnify:CR=1 FL=1
MSDLIPHSSAFRSRRFLNWFPMGITYALLYMGRYNLNEATSALKGYTSNADFGTIFFWGTLTYGFSFLLTSRASLDELNRRFRVSKAPAARRKGRVSSTRRSWA